MLIRPKSMATVVVVLCGVADRSSTPTLAWVMTASVRSGMISETAPTKVVLPAPNPPDTTIFVERVGRPSEPLKATEHPPQECGVTFVTCGRGGSHHLDESQLHHVSDDHAGDSQWSLQADGDLCDRHRALAELDDGGVLRRQKPGDRRVDRVRGRHDESFEVEVMHGTGTPAGPCIRTHHRRWRITVV